MAKKEVVVDLRVESENAGKSLKSLRAEFKETQKELDNMVVGTKEYIQQLEKLGGLKDEIGLLNDQINTFADDAGRINAVGNVVQGLAGGFAAAEGAAALFGAESEDLQRTLVKVQGAMAFQQGLASLANLGDGFKVLQSQLAQTAIGQKIVTAAQWLWNAAVSASPIALLVLAVTALVGVLATLKFSSKENTEATLKFNEALNEQNKAIANSNKSISDLGLEYDLLTGKITKSQAAILKSQKSFDERVLAAKEQFAQAVKDLDDKFDLTNPAQIEQRNAQVLELRKNLDTQLIKLFTEQKKIETNINQAHINELQEAEKVRMAKEAADRDAARKTETEKQRAELEKRRADHQKYLDAQADAINAEADRYDARRKADKEKEKADAIKLAEEQRAYRQQLLDEELEQTRAAAEMKVAIREAELESVKASISVTRDLTDLLFQHQLNQAQGNAAKERQIRKKQFKINKAFGIANSVIDGVQAVQKALNNPYPLNIILAIASGLLATANTAKIASTKFEGDSGGGSGGDISAPRINAGGGANINAPVNNNTQLNPDGTVKKDVQIKQPVVKAVVVETDITGTQNRVSSMEAAAKF